jgi:hypothetical protein
MPKDQDGRIVLTDPRAIRALAHPARLAIIEALLPGEELIATECASLTGLSPSAPSYQDAAQCAGLQAGGPPRRAAWTGHLSACEHDFRQVPPGGWERPRKG